MNGLPIGTVLLCVVAVFLVLAIAAKEWERYSRRQKEREDHINSESSPTS